MNNYNRQDVIHDWVGKVFKFNVVKEAEIIRGAEIMCTTWVVTEKTDHVSKTGSKIIARLCTMGNSSEEFSKDIIQFESPMCGRDTVKAILSLVLNNKWRIGTFDVSSAFFQGDTLERDIYVKNPRAPASGY